MDQKLIPHLFRTEFSKIASVLCRRLGIEHLATAEDIASETFLVALESWPYHGIPEHPVAWLYTVAKNKAKNVLIRSHTFEFKVATALRASVETTIIPDIDLSESNISDSQLKMLFAICDPSIPVEAQIGLALRILCGFGIDEIAVALLSNKETINKRLFRAREKLRQENVSIQFPDAADLPNRLEVVLTTLYLLFSEGYYSESDEEVLREDLCLEAMRLTHLLTNNKQTNLPEVNALLSLMCFQASRFAARKSKTGKLVLYHDQDTTLWDQGLIAKGAEYLHRASGGNQISRYHLEASIAYGYTTIGDSQEKWERILDLYNHLLVVEYSPVAALNRTYALSRVNGTEAAIEEAKKLNLEGNRSYYVLLGELYKDIDIGQSRANFLEALRLARTNFDKQTIKTKLDALDLQSPIT